MLCMLKKKKYTKKSWKTSYSFNDSKRRKGHYLAVKKLSTSLRGLMSKHHGDFYCLNCFHSFSTKNTFESHERVCKNKDFCDVKMYSKDTNILEFNQYQKSDEAPFVIYGDF